MHPLALILLLLLTLATSILLVRSLSLSSKPTVAGISLLMCWLCMLIVPIQLLALLDLARVSSPLRLSHLFAWNGIAFACASALWLRRLKVCPRALPSEVDIRHYLPIPWHVLIGLFIVLCVYVVLTAKMAFSFPDGWDAVAYHYPVALRWLQEGTLRITSTSDWRVSLPGNVELLDLLILSTGRDRFLGVVQWPGLLILLLACLNLGHRIGESPLPAWPVVTTVLMIPIVAIQTFSGYVDLFCSACLFGSLALVLEYCGQVRSGEEAESPAILVFAGLGCGLAVGAKPVYWLYGALLFLGTVFLLFWPGRKRSRTAWRQIVLFSAAVASPSLFWFARAAACTGNPIYPLAVHIGSLSLPGVGPSDITDPNYYLSYVRHWAEWFVYPWTEWKSSPGFLGMNYTPGDGLGGAFATFVMPGVIFAGWLARRRRPALQVWLVALAVVGILWWSLLHKVGRFGLPLFILAAVTAAPFFEVLELRAARLYRTLYVLVFAVTGCILVFEPLYTIVQTIRYGHWSRAAYYGYPPAIDRLHPGSKIVNLGDYMLNYALAGSGLANRVIPNWESPLRLTPEFLRSHEVDYVVQKLITSEEIGVAVDGQAPVAGLDMYLRSTLKEGEHWAEWRIWRTDRSRGDSRQRSGGGQAP